MLTPQEVSERAFPKASFGGYNMGQVDEFLDLLTADYTALYNENAVLKNKMKVLVERVEEYRSTEEAMRKALMTAQRMADDLVREAEQKKAEILAQADAMAREQTASIHKEIEAEQMRLTQAQNATAAYIARVRALHEKEVTYLAQLEELAPAAVPAAPAAAPEQRLNETVSEIDENVQRLLARAMADAAAENAREMAAELPKTDLSDTAEFRPMGAAPAVSATPAEAAPAAPAAPAEEAGLRMSFDNLQFGRDYEIK